MNATPPADSASEGPRIRDFQLQDQPTVRQLIQDGLRSRWGLTFDPGLNPDTDDLYAHYIATGGQITVAEIGGQIVATGILCIEETPELARPIFDGPTIARLRRISVSDDHRRQGLGRLIVEDLVSRAADLRFTHALVSTDTPWVDAVALYRSCGFSPIHADLEETHLLRPIEGH